ncbi:iron-sulfur cluster biosynthesis family protein [Metabacillus herbersteinensis]|uniref:Iron-sulfur cluster biosynthesis family protein n=1 Tax=Metabacillus herbersteinensis TaxID=283816 RepID=A0ABV6GEZ3_9BACI
MNITFTEEAIVKIEGKFENKTTHHLKLKYDTDGCGCVVSGVPALWIVTEKDEDDELIETNYVPVLVEKSKMVFLDEQLKISFNESANSFMLSSPAQILNPRMSLLVK